MQIEFRNLFDKPNLLSTVAQWAYDEWWSKKPKNTVEIVAAAFREHLSDRGIPFTLVAEFCGEPVGMISLVNCDIGMEHRTDLWPWIAAVYVAPERQRQGIGAKLLDAVVAEAKALNLSKLYLYTVDKTEFYERCGWDVLEQEILNEKTAIILSKNI